MKKTAKTDGFEPIGFRGYTRGDKVISFRLTLKMHDALDAIDKKERAAGGYFYHRRSVATVARKLLVAAVRERIAASKPAKKKAKAKAKKKKTTKRTRTYASRSVRRRKK